MGSTKSVRRRAGTCVVLAFGALFIAAPARAERAKLPVEEETEVKRVMEDGVRRLKAAQLPSGTWVEDSHPAGYAALAGLTLLECGVPKNDPVLKKAEAYLRAKFPTMDDTYELSLSVLFLDRLGERRDDEMIQGLALRLVAGQSPTGGWGYKCPNLNTAESSAVFKLLRQVAPKPPAAGAEADKTPPPEPPTALPSNVVVPPYIRGLTIVQDFAKLDMTDPADDKSASLIRPITDNSDTQFALLALWAAQRHGLPIDRPLRLLATRFQNSQNTDGSWGYHYLKGGGAGEGAPMDCCGLLGLAVGHALAQGKEPVNAVKDKKIIDGFAALSKFIGAPPGRMRDVPAANLYFLWSLERVCVLYDVPAFGDKDWYRWGAEAVVANQSPQGDWPDGGGYPGATPTANTCLALLFLARTNLVSDLTAALKLNQDDLAKAITVKVAAPAPSPPPPPVVTPPVVTPPAAPTTPPVAKEPTPPAPAPAPTFSPPVTPPTPTTPAPKAEESGGGMLLPLLLIGLAVLLLLAAGGAVLVLYLRKPKKETKSHVKGKNKKTAGKPQGKAAPAEEPVAKKPQGKKGIRT